MKLFPQNSNKPPKAYLGQSLEKIVHRTDRLKTVFKKDLRSGDIVVIATENSVYSIEVLSRGYYAVSGGWFDRESLAPYKTTITGCTWGGSIINLEFAAAKGLCLEFGNRVTTTPIQSFRVIRDEKYNYN